MEELRRAVPGDALGAVEHVLYATAALTGLREAELLALRWADVELRRQAITCPSQAPWDGATDGAGSIRRRVPLVGRLAADLEEHRLHCSSAGDVQLVFADPETGGPLDALALRTRFAAALQRAGLRAIAFADLRHTFGTHMAAAGAPLCAIEYWMGAAGDAARSAYSEYASDETEGLALAERAFALPPHARRSG